MNKEPNITKEDWEETWERARLLRKCLEMPNEPHFIRMQKWNGLKACGISDKEADKLCTPKELTKEERLEVLAEYGAKERREMDKWNREHNHFRKTKEAPKLNQEANEGIDWTEPPDSTISLLRQLKEFRDKVAALNAKTSVMEN